MSAGKTKGSGLEWFVRRGKVVRGPFSSAKVRHYVIEDRLKLDDEVSPDRESWRPLGSTPEVVPLQMRIDDVGLSPDSAAEQKVDRTRAARAIAIASVLVVGLVFAVTFIGSQDELVERDCAAPPGPGIKLENCSLYGAQMAAAQLQGARLANAVLAAASLSEADLSSADLRYADLTGADLSYANLSQSALLGANLRLADLTNADLSGADLSFADLSGARIGGAQLTGAKFDGTIWVDGQTCTAGVCPR